MLIVIRLLITSIIGLGLANSVFASPVIVDSIYANSDVAEILAAGAGQSNLVQAEIHTALVGSSNSIQNNQLDIEYVKKKEGKISKVAEPSSLILLSLGLLGLGFLRRRKH
jgi:hypothetical protein